MEDRRNSDIDIRSFIEVVAAVLQLSAPAFVCRQLAHDQHGAFRLHDDQFLLQLSHFVAFGGKFRCSVGAVPEGEFCSLFGSSLRCRDFEQCDDAGGDFRAGCGRRVCGGMQAEVAQQMAGIGRVVFDGQPQNSAILQRQCVCQCQYEFVADGSDAPNGPAIFRFCFSIEYFLRQEAILREVCGGSSEADGSTVSGGDFNGWSRRFGDGATGDFFSLFIQQSDGEIREP